MELEEFASDPLKFASLIAHQLQAPLNSVSQSLQTVLGEYTGPLLPSQRGSLEKASERCTQALKAVRRMLAILQAQQDQAHEISSAPLLAVIRQIQGQYTDEAARRSISLSSEIHSPPVRVGIGDPALAEVLSALLDNALKYTPDGGSVMLATEQAPGTEFMDVLVGDSGMGIPENQREKVFEPFYRSAEARHSQRPGIGLGLAFVRSVIRSVGGEISVGVSPFGGALFRIRLPVAAVGESDLQEERKEPRFRVVVIGGVAAGSKAAAKIVRLQPDTDVTVVDRGTVLAYAGCALPYYVSGVVKDSRRLISSPAGVMRDPVFFHNVKHVHVRNHTEATAIDRVAKRVAVVDRFTRDETELPYDKLLLATGASAIVPEGIDVGLKNVFTLHGVRDAEGIRGRLVHAQARDVVIIGGGLLGVEMTESLCSKGCRVTIIEREDRILSMLDRDMSLMVSRHMASQGVKIIMETEVTALEGTDAVSGVAVKDGTTYPADMVILAIGVQPNVELAEDAGLMLGETGAIHVDARMRTADPDIYAAGDCAQSNHLLTGEPCFMPLGATANKEARVAAINICGGNDEFPGILQACICKIFDYCAAHTGLGEHEARDLGYDAISVLVPGPDREHYMPDAGLLLLKLVIDRKTRRLLGLQATGPGAGDKRTDIASMAIRAGMTVDEIAQSDLCYAPPYSAAMDNIITAANVARNKLDGAFVGIKPCHVQHMLQGREQFTLLDVRTPDEYERVHLPRSVLIPLSTLRERLSEVPQDRPVITVCDIALRGYEALLILRAEGFEDVRVMEGGLAMWPYDLVE